MPFRFVLLLIVASSHATLAAEKKGPLASMPSAEGPHIAKVRQLKPQSWLPLGTPKADPKWGTARGRSWTATMPLAPKMRGAFLYGLGVHGYVKPDGHYMDDLWFYDLNAHRWVCCYPGANAKTLDLSINKAGFEADKSGQPIPVATCGHGYQLLTFDTHRAEFLHMPCGDPYWKKPLQRRTKWYRSPPKDAGPWIFESATGRWNRERTGTVGPRVGFGDIFHYVPARKEAIFIHRSRDVWSFDTTKRTWTQKKPGGPKPPFGIDATSCYDSKRQRIYLGGGGYPTTPAGKNAFWIYDIRKNIWIDPKPKGKPAMGSNSYGTNNALMMYDTRNDAVLLFIHSYNYSKKERIGVYVYDPAKNSWSNRIAIPKKLGENRLTKSGFYDKALNAVFISTAGDSRDKGEIWCFRYR